MSEFRWHMMADERPGRDRGNYVVLGVRGGVYLAREYIDESWGRYFREGHGHHIDADKVLAWAEVPPLEDATRPKAHVVVTLNEQTDRATGICSCGLCGCTIDSCDSYCRRCGAALDGKVRNGLETDE